MTANNHADRAHSILSASSADRWINCPGSVTLTAGMSDDRSSAAANEGTAAHEFAELRLKFKLGWISEEQYMDGFDKLVEQHSEFYGPEMDNYVDEYTDQIMEFYHVALAEDPDTEILLETRLRYTDWVPDGFGTGDVIIINNKRLHLADLKYGKGVPVSAIANSQLRMYGLGAIQTLGMLYEFDRIKMTIIQPRLDDISHDEMDVDELFKWADEFVVPAAKAALSGTGKYESGKWCKWCKAKNDCRTRAFKQLELEEHKGKVPNRLSLEELVDVYNRGKELKTWVEEIEKHITNQMVNEGVKIPGLKVVEGRSSRFFKDELNAKLTLIEAGYKSDQIYKPQEMQTITSLEKILGGKKKFELLLGSFIDRKPGNPTVVKEDAPGKAWNPVGDAASVFGDEE